MAKPYVPFNFGAVVSQSLGACLIVTGIAALSLPMAATGAALLLGGTAARAGLLDGPAKKVKNIFASITSTAAKAYKALKTPKGLVAAGMTVGGLLAAATLTGVLGLVGGAVLHVAAPAVAVLSAALMGVGGGLALYERIEARKAEKQLARARKEAEAPRPDPTASLLPELDSKQDFNTNAAPKEAEVPAQASAPQLKQGLQPPSI